MFFRSRGLQPQAYHDTFPSFSKETQNRMKQKNLSENPTTSTKALNVEHSQQTKSTVSKVFNV